MTWECSVSFHLLTIRSQPCLGFFPPVHCPPAINPSCYIALLTSSSSYIITGRKEKQTKNQSPPHSMGQTAGKILIFVLKEVL